MKKSIIILVIIWLIIVSAAVGFVLWQKSAPNENPPGNEGGQGEIDMSGWKTYRNEEYGFEFKYPGEWIIMNEDLYSFTLERTNVVDDNLMPILGVGFFDNNKNETILDWVESIDFFQIKKNQKIKDEGGFIGYGFKDTAQPKILYFDNQAEIWDYYGGYEGGGSFGTALMKKDDKIFVIAYNFFPYKYDLNNNYMESVLTTERAQELFVQLLKTIKFIK